MRKAFVALALSACLGQGAVAVAGTADNVHAATRVFLEGMASGSFAPLRSLYAANFVAHGASWNYTLEQDIAATESWRAAMPDLKVRVQRTVADRDTVAVHWDAVGTNTVAAGGMPGNKDRIGIEGMSFFRFAGGKIAEEWTVVDIATLRQQLGQ